MPVATKNTAGKQPAEDTRKPLKAVALRTYLDRKTSRNDEIEHERVAEFLPMVQRITHRVATYIKPPLSFEDLVSAGTIGLIKAARDFDPSHKAGFKTYAYIRIKGAILDELRASSLLPPHINKKIQNACELSWKITEKTGIAPTDEELAEKLGINVDEIYEIFEKARAQNFISIDSFVDATPARSRPLATADTTSPDKQLERTELIDKLTEAIQKLDRRQQQIIVLYYKQNLTMKQIADLFNITESRVSQLHASALFNLSMKLRQWKDAG